MQRTVIVVVMGGADGTMSLYSIPVKGRANAIFFLLQTSHKPLYDVVGELPSAEIALCDAVGEQESVQI